MTRQEHLLVLTVTTQILGTVHALAKGLHSKGLLSDSEFLEMQRSALSPGPELKALLRAAKENYIRMGKLVDLDMDEFRLEDSDFPGLA